jgi:hypothetical protein
MWTSVRVRWQEAISFRHWRTSYPHVLTMAVTRTKQW